MTAAECLSQLTDIRRRIEALNETIAKCYSSASKSTPSYGGEVGGGTSDNRIERNVEKAIEHERQLQKLTEQFDQFAYDMTLEINRISNNIYAALLIQKYVNGNSWEMGKINTLAPVQCKLQLNSNHLLATVQALVSN